MIFQKNVLIENVIDGDQYGMGRTAQELIVSASLARFNEEARELYNIGLLHDNNVSNDGWQGSVGSLEPLGIETAYKFTQAEANILQKLFFNPGNIIPTPTTAGVLLPTYRSNFLDTAMMANYDVYMGVYNETLKDEWIAWERDISNFLGRHYIH